MGCVVSSSEVPHQRKRRPRCGSTSNKSAPAVRGGPSTSTNSVTPSPVKRSSNRNSEHYNTRKKPKPGRESAKAAQPSSMALPRSVLSVVPEDAAAALRDDGVSSERWELPPTTREGSRLLEVYSLFQSTTALPSISEANGAGGEAAARVEAVQSHKGRFFADLLSPDGLCVLPPATKAAPTTAAATIQRAPVESNAHSYALLTPRCEGTGRNPLPSYPLQQKQPFTNAGLTAGGDVDAIHITSPNNNGDSAQSKNLSTSNETSGPISGGGRQLSTGPPAALTKWCALPLPPASISAPPIHAVAVVTQTPAVSGIVQGTCTVPPPSAPVAHMTAGAKPRTGSRKKNWAKRKKRKLALPPLPVSQNDLPNLRSILRPSLAPPRPASPDVLLSAPPSVLPSFRVGASTPPTVEVPRNQGKVSSHANTPASTTAAVAATTTAIETAATSLPRERDGASPVRSLLGSTPDHNNSLLCNHCLDYGSLLIDDVEALPTRLASTPTVEKNPSTSIVRAQAVNTGFDINNNVSHQRKEDEAISETEHDVERVFSLLRNNAGRSTQDVMDTSLLYTPPRDSLQHSSSDDKDADISSMGSPAEMCLPHARNLRPRQWQYASVLQRKIGEKVKKRQTAIVAEGKKAHPKTGSRLQRQISPGMTPATVRRASTGAQEDGKGQQQLLTQFPLQPTTCRKGSDDTPALLERLKGDVGGASHNGFEFPNCFPPDAVRVSAAAVPLSPVKQKRRPSPVRVHREAVQHHEEAEEGAAVRATDSPATPLKCKSRHSASASGGRLFQRVAGDAPSPSSGATVDDEGTVPRASSLLSFGASVFTDNGYPVLATHLSDFYRESLTSLSEMSTTSLSTTTVTTAMEDTRDKAETSLPGVVMVDGRLLLQGMGYPTTAINNNSFKSTPITFGMQHHLPCGSSDSSSPNKGGRVGSMNPKIGGSMTAMPPVKGCRPPVPPRRWSTTMASMAAIVLPPPMAASRQQLLRDQQRRLLREQRLHLRQLRNINAAGVQPQTAAAKTPAVTGLAMAGAEWQPQADTLSHASPPATCSVEFPTRHQQMPEKQCQQQQPPALPMPPTREMLATAFFVAEESNLKLKHRGTTAKATPQPDIHYGPFVATDKSRFVDFEKALGFNLKDVPTIKSPSWDSLSAPQPTVDSEEL